MVETIEDIIDALDKLYTKYDKTEFRNYCFEHTCRYLERENVNPMTMTMTMTMTNKSFNNLITIEANSCYDKVKNDK